MLVNSALQLNPTIYKDPLVFNPWRWKVYDSSFSQLLHTFFFLILLMFFMAISLTAFFVFNGTMQNLDPLVVSKNFMPFGGGIRQCAGAEYSKTFMATFLHVLVTKYR